MVCAQGLKGSSLVDDGRWNRWLPQISVDIMLNLIQMRSILRFVSMGKSPIVFQAKQPQNKEAQWEMKHLKASARWIVNEAAIFQEVVTLNLLKINKNILWNKMWQKSCSLSLPKCPYPDRYHENEVCYQKTVKRNPPGKAQGRLSLKFIHLGHQAEAKLNIQLSRWCHGFEDQQVVRLFGCFQRTAFNSRIIKF